MSLKYGIVVDSGSSGSRIQVYSWEDQSYVRDNSQDQSVLRSPPNIAQLDDWNHKITPGISTYADKPKDLWKGHFLGLMKFAESIIPREKQSETPVFVLATAGMRLLPEKKQRAILKETCTVLRKNTNFYLPNCHDFVQVIDGETEGLYGWVGLNYLMGQFNDYQNLEGDSDASTHESIGFMDMGGALTQIAFVPSSQEDIIKHNDDLSTITLRNINGETQSWKVFVETWLGFGANEARRRYLNQLVNSYQSSPKISNSKTLNDPCLPNGAELDYQHSETKKKYTIKGTGDYKLCIKTIYPLLLKDIPCTDTPCLFNGIHGPKLDFNKDKFIGILEYWYTANDIFQSGGEYNYHAFNEKVKEFCESDWSKILENSSEGQYSNLDPEKFLKTACFKASWVMNILHEGFELPRLGLDPVPEDDKNDKELTEKLPQEHIPFKSANSVNGDELSWTLGKMVLFALSQISPQDSQDLNVGIYPSEISGEDFVPGGGSTRLNAIYYDSDDDNEDGSQFLFFGFIFLILFIFAWWVNKTFSGTNSNNVNNAKVFFGKKFRQFSNLIPIRIKDKIPGLNYFNGYGQMREHEQMSYDLEQGLDTISSEDGYNADNATNLSVLRTRSTVNLSSSEGSPEVEDNFGLERGNSNINLNGGRYTPNFLNKPFAVPKKSPVGVFLFQDNNGSRESLSRSLSSTSLKKTKE